MNNENILAVKLDRKEKLQTVRISYFYPELKRNRDEDITDVPHPDFNAAILALSPFIANVFYASEDKVPLYSATGYKYSRDRYVILTGKVSTESGAIVGIATPAINLEDNIYGFEEELNDCISTLSLEALLLLNGSKLGVQQLTIDDAIKDNEEDEEKEKENTQELNDELDEDDDTKDEFSEKEETEYGDYLDATTIKDVPDNDDFMFDPTKDD